jgi:replicative DNA helicase
LNIEQQILSQIVHNEQYARAVLPHLKKEYFSDEAAQNVLQIIEKFTTKYPSIPSIGALQVEIDTIGLNQDAFDAASQLITTIKYNDPVDYEWMLDQTEKYCQEKAMNIALREAITIQTDPERSNGEITQIMQDALSVTFDSKIGHDYFDNAEERYDKLHSRAEKIPFDIEILNTITQGGIEKKTLNIIMSGCVHPETTVLARWKHDGVERIKTITMIKLKELLDAETEVDVHSPDGFVRVLEFVEKGLFEEYIIRSGHRQVRCNADHLVKTTWGWERTEVIAAMTETYDDVHLASIDGYVEGAALATGMMIPIVDIVVDHENHRYYANGVESHNTNVGKSLIMCHLAAANVLQGMNVLYITAEMSEEKIAQRIDANLIDLPLDKHKDMPKKWFIDRVAEIKKKSGGRFIVKEYAANAAHAGHIRHLLQELRQKKGFVPDIIYVDYINIMACQRYSTKVARHLYIQGIAEELRAIGQTEEIPVWSATQTNREGAKSSDADITDVSEAWGLPATADFFLIVIQPDELAELGQYLVKQEKSRYDDKGKHRKFTIGVDKSRMKLHDLDVQPYLAGNTYEQDIPVFDNTESGERLGFEGFRK